MPTPTPEMKRTITRKDSAAINELPKKIADPFLADLQRQMADTVAEFIVAEGHDPDRRRLLAYGIVGLGESTCRRWLEKEIDLDADELAVQVAGLAWSGLRGLSPN